MGEGSPPVDDVFDLERVRKLIELMKEHDLCQIDLRQGVQRIALSRAGSQEASVVRAAPRNTPVVESDVRLPPAAPPATENAQFIKSPTVGTFYVRPNPKAAAFVKVGDLVEPSTVVCIVEAMKVFNEIPAETSGRIVAVLVEDGESVEFGQNLFRIERVK